MSSSRRLLQLALVLFLARPLCAAWDKGFDFRATSAFVTDPAYATYVLGDLYPVTRNSVTFGWNATLNGGTADRSTTVDVRLAGINYQTNNGTQDTFRVDLPATGAYTIGLALGDENSAQAYQYLKFEDNTTVFATLDESTGTANDQFYDASGVKLSGANWPGSNATISHTFTSTILNVVIGTPTAQTNATTLAHLRVTQSGAACTNFITLLGAGCH